MKVRVPLFAAAALLATAVPLLALADAAPAPMDGCLKAFLQAIPTRSGNPPTLRSFQYLDTSRGSVVAGDEVELTARDGSSRKVVARATCVVDGVGTLKDLRAEPLLAVK